ncbi:type II secretion system protein [Halomarina oriensis]|uniref:Type II secretion system protein n=1 Tax=Halomarina oriensis TaxID=671145 RepID=A0A6B0GUN1_9EURY|nr:type II secretion system protein [Halomarina oriensis]MWG35428.1 type II secretion system protein [Halomarina oriensis]
MTGPFAALVSTVGAALDDAASRLLGGLDTGTDDTDALADAMVVLGWSLSPATVRRTSDAAALVGGLVTLGLAILAPWVAPLGVAGTAACWYGLRRLPHVLTSAREEAALGAAPVLVSRAVLRMRLEPTVERAAAFAASADDGPLARSLAEHVRRARGTPASGLGAWGDRWGERFPALRRAASLVEAAGRAPAGDRSRTLDRAMRAILDGAGDRTAAAAAALHGPVTALYAFGVLLPLALVAVLPAARVAGLGLTLPVVVALYDVALPATIAVASGWLLLRRPATFPATPVPADHPDLPERRWPVVVAATLLAALAWLLVARLLASWMAPLAALGTGVGLALVGWFRPAVAVRTRTRAVEEGLPDALALVGRRVGEGRAVEAAIETVSAEVSGPIGDVLADTARRQRTLRVGVGEALYGEHGALSTVPSARVDGTLGLLVVAAREGAPAGDALVVVADHVERLHTVERDARRELRRVTGTLTNTAAVFGPLVGGVTVALAASMGGRVSGAGGTTGLGAVSGTSHSPSPAGGLSPSAATTTVAAGSGIPVDGLALAVGAYVLSLAALLTALATALEHGGDRAHIGYRVGLVLPVATVLYLGSYLVAGAMV